ncbi:MAG TPA: energy-coupling factor ABC transporter substrate-binding protein [Chloroflexota bacterium]|jgi:cobalt/nickel transport protein|nr:energy-coupling factor ABC transporter substrate-binding protein [Chloroflexota bacterium]
MSLWVKNLLLAILVVVLVAVPLLFTQGAEWGATDGRNTEAIQELQPDYEPWFAPFFSAADAGIEHYMFGLQALLGSLVLSGIVGWLIGRYRGMTGTPSPERRLAWIVIGVGLVIAAGLFFVTTEFGELQAFIAALQGVLIGLLGYFVGYPLGERHGRERAAAGARASVMGEGPRAS